MQAVAALDAATGKPLVGAASAGDGESVLVSGSVYPPSRRLGEPAVGEGTAAAAGLFDWAGGKLRYPFADPTDGTAFRSAGLLTLAPNGCRFAVAEHDHSVTVYERASGAVRRRLRGHANQVFRLASTADGSRLVSVS